MSWHGTQGANAEQEAQRLREEVEREQLNVKAALQALEAEKARMAARAAAEKKRLLEKVGVDCLVRAALAGRASLPGCIASSPVRPEHADRKKPNSTCRTSTLCLDAAQCTPVGNASMLSFTRAAAGQEAGREGVGV